MLGCIKLFDKGNKLRSISWGSVLPPIVTYNEPVPFLRDIPIQSYSITGSALILALVLQSASKDMTQTWRDYFIEIYPV